MIPLYQQLDFDSADTRHMFDMQCIECSSTFRLPKRDILQAIKGKQRAGNFCSRKCHSDHKKHKWNKTCALCSTSFYRKHHKSKSGLYFCNTSCAAKYNNVHKTHGTRRSKLEVFLEEELTKLYPKLGIHFNRKDTILSELDIYIPSLKLAIELNGIFHYEPIYGADKLASIQTNDGRKFQACLEHGIELFVIDISNIEHFKPQKGFEILVVINLLIEKRLEEFESSSLSMARRSSTVELQSQN
jgi:hypothetical protein